MPIKRLQRATASFPRIGKLRKGDVKNPKSPGKDLDYFRFDSDDELANEKFQDVYGDKPDTILVYLPCKTRLENFDSWQEAYLAGGLQHRCDGETCVIWLDPTTGKYSQEPKICPGGCKEVGRLNVIIPALERFAYVTVETHSINDILTLEGNLDSVFDITGTLQGIPFMLKRRNRKISTPDPKSNKRISRVKSLLLIEVEETWAALRFTAMQRNALTMAADNTKMLTADDYRVVDVKTGEITEGSLANYDEAATISSFINAPDASADIEIDMETIEEINPTPGPDKFDGLREYEGVGDSDAPGKFHPNPFEDERSDPVTEVTKALTLKDDAKMRKQFHAVGTEAYGKNWNDKRYDLVKAIASDAKSSNELTIDHAQTLIDGMRKRILATA